jgi:hypothetical protein
MLLSTNGSFKKIRIDTAQNSVEDIVNELLIEFGLGDGKDKHKAKEISA